MRLPDPSPVLDKNRAPMGPEILSSTGAGFWRKAPMGFPDSSSVLDNFKIANFKSQGRQRFESLAFSFDERTARHSTVRFVRKVRNLSAKCAGAISTGSHNAQ